MSGWLSLFFSLFAAANPMGDVIVVRPSAWSAAIQSWKLYREQEGYRVIEIEPAATAIEMRAKVSGTLRTLPSRTGSDGLRELPFVALMSDCPSYQDRNSQAAENRIPVFYVDSKVGKNFGSEPIVASDQPYADFDQDGHLDAIVGRVPASSPAELQRYLDRVLRFERDTVRKDWSREIDVVAGVGDFGVVADTLIEGVTRQLLVDDLPEIYRLSMTQASPKSNYCPAPSSFCKTVVQRLNDGGVFWVYLGHGFVDTLDYLQFVEPPMPILSNSSVSSISIPNGPPIAIFLACYIAAFDAKEPCIAERMLLHTDGPIAIIGGSRVTMPYAMGLLGSELIRQSFVERKDRVGTLLSEAKRSALVDEVDQKSEEPAGLTGLGESKHATRRRMMDTMAMALSPAGHSLNDERIEHNYLFNLLGDPLIRIHHPKPLEIEVPISVTAGDRLLVRGTSPSPGRLSCEIAYRRSRIPDRLKELKTSLTAKTSETLQQQIYDAANNLTISTVEQSTDVGSFQFVLPIDAQCHGSYQVHVILDGEKTWWAGTKEFQVTRQKAETTRL
jgi:Peptidase family C25